MLLEIDRLTYPLTALVTEQDSVDKQRMIEEVLGTFIGIKTAMLSSDSVM